MRIASDYVHRVYAGVLGKIIGVYIGRPIENWTHERIEEQFGEVWYYVNDRLKHALIVPDDDISGTFTFLRALDDHGVTTSLTPEQIGKTWLNYIIENKSILWWGGMGNSTEHTAFLRLKNGIPAPQSGSIKTNGKVVAEQIGAQIFIDGWGMICPGDPELAADFARKAGSVSHDGEAIYGAQMIAAMEAQAFVEPDLRKLIETGLKLIPEDSVIYRMVSEICELREKQPDWRAAFTWLKSNYGYDKYGGNCHMVPNHGLIQLALLWSDDNFQKALMVSNTCGWDVDCNSANVGCIMGIKNGLAGIDAGADLRTPVADRMYLPTADGGRTVNDAVQQTYWIVNLGRTLAGEKPLAAPKGGARFHFELPGSLQGFFVESHGVGGPAATIENVPGHSSTGTRSLAIRAQQLATGRSARVLTQTFATLEPLKQPGYSLTVSPTIYAGQTLEAGVEADEHNRQPIAVRCILQFYDAQDQLQTLLGELSQLGPGGRHALRWTIPDTGGMPIVYVGIELVGDLGASGTVYLDRLGWTGEPTLTLRRFDGPNTAWRRAWVEGADQVSYWGPETVRVIQNRGRGLVMYGTREWRDYRVETELTPHMVSAFGLAIRAQGMRRYYALLLLPGKAQLVKVYDDETCVLSEAAIDWNLYQTIPVGLESKGQSITATVQGTTLAASDDSLDGGALGLICDEGRCGVGPVTVKPSR